MQDYFLPAPVATGDGAPANLGKAKLRMAYKNYLARSAVDRDWPFLLPLLYCVKDVSLDLDGSPEALRLCYSVPDAALMLGSIKQDAQNSLMYDADAKEYAYDDLEGLLLPGLERYALAYADGKASDLPDGYTFSLFALPADISPFELLRKSGDPETLNEVIASSASSLADYIGTLPDYPAVAAPKGGILQGKNDGTLIKFSNKNEQRASCLLAYASGSDTRLMTVYIPAASTVNLHLPQGSYDFFLGTGMVWYGTQHLFGENADYYRETYDVPSSRYYVTWKFGISDGEPMAGAELSDIP